MGPCGSTAASVPVEHPAARKEPATLCAFDVLMIGRREVREIPLAARKTRLARLLDGVEGLHYVEHLEAHGEALFAKVLEVDLEGIVAKRVDSRRHFACTK